MLEPRLKKVADTVIDYSLDIKINEKVLIESTKSCGDLIKYMVSNI